MHDLIYILSIATLFFLAAYLFHLYRVQRSAVNRVLHLITALSQRQYTRRTDASLPGAAGELATAVNTLAENLEGRAAKAQLDSDHLLSLLAVLDHTNEIAIATDSTDNIRLANPAAARVLGRSADQLLGKQLDSVVTHAELLALFRNAFHSAKPISSQVTLQTPASPNGTPGRILHCQATAATIYNGAHYRGTLLLLRDITEIARTLQIKTDFVANASHELRTPLASILAAVETLKESESEQSESGGGEGGGNGAIDARSAHRCVDIIHNHARRLELIITDLLDLSRAEDPNAAIRTDTIDIEHVAQQVISLYAASAAEKHVQLRIDLADDAKSLRGDERLLHLTLKNLLDNAIKFTAAGTITIRSRIAAAKVIEPALQPAGAGTNDPPLVPTDHWPPATDHLTIEVEDTGCGIPLADQQRVFERFYTVNRSRGGADRGTGLGLAIVKHAVAAMGGYVTLASEPGKGTTLSCHFPRPQTAD